MGLPTTRKNSKMELRKDGARQVFGPFRAGDSLRVYRLQRKGISLDLQWTLTQSHTPLWEAWLAFVTQQAMGQPTFVLSDLHDGEGFIQIRYRPHQAAADVVFLSPLLGDGQRAVRIWAQLLDGACIEAAGRGIQRVFANLPESGEEVDVFQQTGFTLYAGEDVYRLEQTDTVRLEGELLSPRPQRPEDWPAIQKLCVAVTPQRVRQAEGGIAVTTDRERNCQRYVLPGSDGEDLMAALSICGSGGPYWLRVLVHPDARDVVEGLIRWVLTELARLSAKPVYCNVRQYESGVRMALGAAGFEPYATRALMVKHTMALGKAQAQELAPALKSSAEALPPAYRINGEPELQAPNGRLAATRDM
jgi:hypothetical protein